MAIEIRAADAGCATDIARLECSLGRHEWNEAGVVATLSAPSNAGLIALKDGVQVGHVLYAHVLDECEILSVVVDSEYRRQGIAHKLMKRAADRTQARIMHLEVRESNSAAIALYRALGFTDVGRRKGYYRDGEDALVMQSNPDVASADT